MSSNSTTIQQHKTSNPYKAKFGYSRALRKGPFIFVSGTTSIDPTTGVVQFPSSAYNQTKTIFSEIIHSIEALGGTKEDVVRLRLFVKDESDCEDVGRAMKEAFGIVGPAATMVCVGFVSPDMKVEIEADALVM
jgi:enamine deaminase RidA (YjgF/YER057c/UK114 family)